MNASTARFAAVLIGLALPTVAQLGEAEVHFSLSTERTFGTEETPRIRFWGNGFDRLQFRVYRVNDPLKFFRRLDDPNQFGGQAPRARGELTALEKFHRWKRNCRAWMRNVVRRQYTAENREQIRETLATRARAEMKPSTPNAQKYADVPVLNQQQVVAVWEQSRQVKNSWEMQMVPVDVKERGVYLVEATDGKLQAYTIVVISDLVLITKAAEGRVIARVVDRRTGQPVPGAGVHASSGNREIANIESSKDGFFEIKPAAGSPEDDMIFVANRNKDYAPSVISRWSLRQNESDNLTAYVYTDRPVYRPGHEVHYRAIVRARRATSFELPTSEDLDLQIDDPEGNTVVRRKLKPNAIGTVSGNWTLPAGAALGYYGVSLRNGERYAGTGGFHVEEYRKPEYAVKVTPEQPRVLQGSKVRATVEARYYFGEPVPGGKVTYVVHRSRYWPAYYLDEAEEPEAAEAEDEYSDKEQMSEQTGTLDAEGRLSIEVATEPTRHDMQYRIEARVTDEGKREVSGTGFVLATRGPYYLHAEPDKYVYSAGDRAKIRVEARDYEGNFVPNIDFNVELRPHRGDNVIARANGRTDANGVGAAEVTVTGGYLVAKIISRTPEGREIEDDTYLWVSGGEGFSYDRQQRIEIVPDKKSYSPGDTAKILLVTGNPYSSIWVTAETTGVLRSTVVEAKGPTASVEIPIRSEYAPNIFVTAVFVREGQLFTGTKSLKVPPAEHKLDVSVKPSQQQFRPGERGLYTIEAKDSAGKPVSAEFSVGVVDEAIYAIRREAVPDILSFFYGKRYNGVSTSSSIHYSFYGSSGKRRMQLARLNTKRRAQFKPERFVDPRVRKAFPDTIFWSAGVRTGANGRAEVPVTFPDSLTTWRATVRGVTADTRVGSAVDRTIVRKNMVVRIAAPRFFIEGDEVTISAIAQNYLASEKTVRVSMEMQGVEKIDGAVQDLTIPARGTGRVDYRVRATTPGSAIITAKALTDEESDAMEITLPVKPYGVKLSDSRTGSLPGTVSQADTEMTFPQEANPSSRTIEISVSPSVAGTLFGALEYLTTFPYGCTEQIMSSFLPNLIVAKASKELGVRTTIDEAALTAKIRAGFDRLYDYQHDDGGWGWWETDDGHLFMTAYVVAGLAQAQAAGHSVKPDALGKGIEWLKSALPKERNLPADLRAYVAYALSLAGAPDAALFDGIWNARSQLSPYGIAVLGLAVRDHRKDLADAIATELEARVKASDQEASWEVSMDPLLGIGLDTTTEATAHALHFLSLHRPNSPLLPKAAAYLVNHRNEGMYWSSTKQTAMVIYGLIGYLKLTRELQPEYSVAVFVNDKQVATKRLTPADALTTAVPIRVAATQPSNRIRIVKSGTGMLYWGARAEYFSTSERQMRAGSGVLGIAREMFKLSPSKRDGRVVYSMAPLSNETLSSGDLIAVRLKVTGTEWRYLMIEDPIPAGTEFVPRDDLYELEQKPDWWSRWSTRREFRDDRAAMFDLWFGRGESQYSYLLKVVNPGRFRLPPARVEPMYQPGVFATSDARTLEVK